MTQRLKANDETWNVRLSREAPHEGVAAVIFQCTSNTSFGWRVVEVPAGELKTQESVDGLSESDLRDLFARSQPFDYSHDPKAREWAVGEGGGRRRSVEEMPHTRSGGRGEAPTTK